MKNSISVFDTLYDTLYFLRNPNNIRPEQQKAADALVEEISQLGSAIELIISAVRTYHRLIRDEGIWEEPGVAMRHIDSLGLTQRHSFEECLMQANALLETTLAETGAVDD